MLCKVCLKRIKVTINFKTFFKVYLNNACKSCFKEHMNHFPYFVIPINGGLLHIFELLYEKPNNNEYFSDYFRPYYVAYLKSNPTIDAIFIETLNIETIDLFDHMNLGHLIIFTNNVKED